MKWGGYRATEVLQYRSNSCLNGEALKNCNSLGCQRFCLLFSRRLNRGVEGFDKLGKLTAMLRRHVFELYAQLCVTVGAS